MRLQGGNDGGVKTDMLTAAPAISARMTVRGPDAVVEENGSLTEKIWAVPIVKFVDFPIGAPV